MKKITGHLEEDKGKWYAAVNHYGPDNKRHVKWYNLDVEAKRGNKRKAEERLTELLKSSTEVRITFRKALLRRSVSDYGSRILRWTSILSSGLKITSGI